MSKYDKAYLAKRSLETGFIRDNLEKVYRLVDVLQYINTNPLLSEYLVLKGGTAINLTVFNMPRLSVDIDLDFNCICSKSEMLDLRAEINTDLMQYMEGQGYNLDIDKGKNLLSLDSWVFYYQNSVGNKDNIKIEINYSMRNHILPINKATVNVGFLENTLTVNALNPIELFGSKIKALIERTAPRDLYDIYNMLHFGIFDETEQELLKKCVIFYLAVGGSKAISTNISFDSIDNLSFSKIKQTLLPVIRKSEKFDFEVAKAKVKQYLEKLMQFNEQDKAFINNFNSNKYMPELLFDDDSILKNICEHPMALWKTRVL